MAAVLEEQKNPAAKFGSQVDEQIAQATSRIRAHDLTFGALTLAAITAIYATVMILIDKYLNLNEWIRQISFLGFVGVFAATAYWLVVRPLRNRINPLYAATRVEKTIDDAKNSVTGYVEAQEKGDIHNAVKAAMSAKAARAVGDADVNKAIDHRSLIVVGGVFVFFLLTLIVLFFVFRPTQFNSLLGRSFVPFSSGTIASRTQLTLIKPDPVEPTITNGQTITVVVHVGGKVPAKESPNRVRVLIRHNQSDPDYEEVVMKEGETSRDWQVKIPEDLVLNGFWYKVAAGDTETPEYRVTVRSLPLFTGFEATYEYPAYTRKAVDKAFSADIRANPGTKVTLIARTNREVQEGLMKLEMGGLVLVNKMPAPVVNGKPVPNQPDSLVFQFTVKEQAKYKLFMMTTAGEKNTDPPAFTINIDSDLPPTVQITKPEVTKPEEAEITAPANGQLAVDATVGDDYGIDKVRLCLRVVGGRDLASLPYMGGQSFHRAKDDTWPRDLAYKDSADLTKLKYADGTSFEPKEGMQIEYWVEAIDNCTEAQPVPNWNNQIGNVGRSNVQRLSLTAPKTKEDKQQLDENKGDRKNEEKQHNQAQQQKFDNEKRDKPPQNSDPKKGEGQPNGEPNNGGDSTTQPKAGDMTGMGMGDPMSKNPDNKNPDNTQPTKPENKNTPPKNSNDPQNTQPGGMGPGGMPDPNTSPKPPEQKGSDTPPQPMGGTNNNGMPPKSPEQKGGEMPPQPMGGTNNNGMGMSEKGGMDNNPNPMPSAPMPQSLDEKKAEEQAKQVQQELDKTKRPESEAKSNPAAKPEDRTNPGQPKPQPKDGNSADAQPKEEPKPNDPMNNPMGGGKNAPSESKPEGNVEKSPDPAQPKPSPSDSNNPKQKSTQPSETRDEPLGGTPGQDKPEPKQDGTKPKEEQPKNQDPTSGSTAKPSADRKDDNGSEAGRNDTDNKPNEKDPAKNAGSAKPKSEPGRGQDKTPADQKGGSGEQTPEGSEAGKSKPQTAPETGTAKRGKQGPMDKEPDNSEPKPAPADMNPNDPMNGAAQSKPDQAKSPMGSDKNTTEKGVEKGMDKSDPKNGGDQKDQLDPKKLEELKNAAKDLGSSDPKKREEAREKLDKSIGEQNRKAFEEYQKKEQEKSEQLQKDLQSPDKNTRETAEKKVDELMKQNPKKGGGDQNPDPKKLEELKEAAKNLNNPDPKKREEARDKLDKAIGEQNRKQLEELKDAAKDLNNPDPKKSEEARNKLDKAIGEQNRKALEESQKKKQEEFDHLQKDLQSSDKATRESAEKKVDDLMKKAKEEARKENGGGAGGQKDQKLDPKQLEELKNAAKDLDSTDPKKREEARDKLDKAIGEQNRKALEEYQKKEKESFDQLQKDLQSSDKATREAAEKKVDELMKKGAEQAKKESDGKAKELSPQEVADLVKKAKDLNSNDEAKRKEAEKALDDQIGKEAREKLQEEMKNKTPGDKENEELQKKIEEEAKKQANRGDPTLDPNRPQNPPIPNTEKLKPAIDDDPRNRAKTAELQLEEFEKNRYNRDLQDRLGWTPEKYEEFLKAQQKRVEQLQKEAAAFEQQAQKPVVPPTGPATINSNSGTKVEGLGNGIKGNATGTGAVFAPPGFEDAKKKFVEDAKKLQPKP